MDNLLKQDFTISEKKKVWCTDFTYMRQANGRFRYSCTIIDLIVSCTEPKISCNNSDLNGVNGNDTFSPHSPKVVTEKWLEEYF